MLDQSNRDKIVNLFLDNPLEKFQLREIGRKTKISTPSVKKYLGELKKSNLIKKEVPKTKYPVYFANREAEFFKQLKIFRTLHLIKKSKLLDHLEETLQPDCIILFGSSSKGEDVETSDIDLYIKSSENPEDLRKFETKLHKEINITLEEDFKKLSSELKNNIVNGILLKGYLQVWE